MLSTTEVSASQKSAYQRPYKTRRQRREVARRQHAENTDQKFLIRVAIVVGVLLLLAVGVALKGAMEPETPSAPVTEVLR